MYFWSVSLRDCFIRKKTLDLFRKMKHSTILISGEVECRLMNWPKTKNEWSTRRINSVRRRFIDRVYPIGFVSLIKRKESNSLPVKHRMTSMKHSERNWWGANEMLDKEQKKMFNWFIYFTKKFSVEKMSTDEADRIPLDGRIVVDTSKDWFPKRQHSYSY